MKPMTVEDRQKMLAYEDALLDVAEQCWCQECAMWEPVAELLFGRKITNPKEVERLVKEKRKSRSGQEKR